MKLVERVSNLKLKKKIFLFAGVILFLFLIMFTWTLSRISKNIAFLNSLSKEQIIYTELNEIRGKHQVWMNKMSYRVINHTISDSLYITEKSYTTCAFGKWYAGEHYKKALKIRPDLKTEIAAVDSVHRQLHEVAYAFNRLCYEKKITHAEAESYFSNKLIPHYLVMQDKLDRLLAKAKPKKEFDQIYKFVTSMAVGLIIMFVLALGIIIGLVLLLVKDLTIPLEHINQLAKRIAEGDLTRSISYHRKDEFGEVIDSINKMIVILQNVIESVADSVEGFVDVTEMVDVGAREISQTVSAQADAVEQVHNAMGEMLASINENITGANQTKSIAKKVTENAEKGQSKINQAAEMLREIAKKITVISELAYQSNILSLNASIEASRAGEKGKGFGVVASEIGDLAEESKTSAATIESLSNQSILVADESQALFGELLQDIERTYQFITNIVEAGVQQQSGANRINTSVAKLNEVAGSNAASAESLANNAGSMKEQIEMLQEMIKHFTT